jgi:hypothetical protein
MDGIGPAGHFSGFIVDVALLVSIAGAYICTMTCAFLLMPRFTPFAEASDNKFFRSVLRSGATFAAVLGLLALVPHNHRYDTGWALFSVQLAGIAAGVVILHGSLQRQAEESRVAITTALLRAERAAERATRANAEAFLNNTPRAISRDVAGRLGYEAGARLAVVARLTDPQGVKPVKVDDPPLAAPPPIATRTTSTDHPAGRIRDLVIERLVTIGPPLTR